MQIKFDIFATVDFMNELIYKVEMDKSCAQRYLRSYEPTEAISNGSAWCTIQRWAEHSGGGTLVGFSPKSPSNLVPALEMTRGGHLIRLTQCEFLHNTVFDELS